MKRINNLLKVYSQYVASFSLQESMFHPVFVATSKERKKARKGEGGKEGREKL